jgi:small subunit ribosomal protein S2e
VIHLFFLTIRESEIIDFFLGTSLKAEVLKIVLVWEQTQADQSTRFKALTATGDYNGHFGLGAKSSKEVAIAIRGTIILAIIPGQRSY